MNLIDVQTKLQNLTKVKISLAQIGEVLGVSRAAMSKRARLGSDIGVDELKKIENYYNVQLFDVSSFKGQDVGRTNNVVIPYYPNVAFSAGYGIEVYDDVTKEYITIDERLFRTDRGTKINPKFCELLTISGNSMSPKWEDGDRFILDKSVTSFIDGQTFAFKLNGECYIKEICLLGKRAKAIPLNKSYDEFYIEPEDELTIFGRVIPKVRL